jgi:hypothetical protein
VESGIGEPQLSGNVGIAEGIEPRTWTRCSATSSIWFAVSVLSALRLFHSANPHRSLEYLRGYHLTSTY